MVESGGAAVGAAQAPSAPEEPPQAMRRLMAIPGVFYGGGCAYMACRGLMMGGVDDVLLITHGPVGCAYYSGINGFQGEPDAERPSFAARTFSTHMNESDIVFGGQDKLASAIDQAVERFHPRAVAVCATCPVGLIGDDIDQAARDAAARHGIDVLPLSCEGFKAEPGWLIGGRQILDRWVEDAPDARAARRSGRSLEGAAYGPGGPFTVNFMSESFEGRRRAQVQDLLGRVGYDVVCSLMGATTYEAIRKSGSARLVVLDSGKAIDEVGRMYERRFGCGFMRVSLLGAGNTARSLRAMAAFFGDEGLAARTEEVIGRELRRTEAVREACRREFGGRVAAVFEDIFRSDDYATLSLEAGMDVVMVAQDYSAKEYTEEGYVVHVPSSIAGALRAAGGCGIDWAAAETADALPGCAAALVEGPAPRWERVVASRAQVAGLLARIEPDICFAGIEERFGCRGATMRSERFLSDERGTDYRGFDAVSAYARDLRIARASARWAYGVPAWARPFEEEGGRS